MNRVLVDILIILVIYLLSYLKRALVEHTDYILHFYISPLCLLSNLFLLLLTLYGYQLVIFLVYQLFFILAKCLVHLWFCRLITRSIYITLVSAFILVDLYITLSVIQKITLSIALGFILSCCSDRLVSFLVSHSHVIAGITHQLCSFCSLVFYSLMYLHSYQMFSSWALFRSLFHSHGLFSLNLLS